MKQQVKWQIRANLALCSLVWLCLSMMFITYSTMPQLLANITFPYYCYSVFFYYCSALIKTLWACLVTLVLVHNNPWSIFKAELKSTFHTGFTVHTCQPRISSISLQTCCHGISLHWLIHYLFTPGYCKKQRYVEIWSIFIKKNTSIYKSKI